MLSVAKALDHLTKVRLQDICREQGHTVAGNKDEVIARLVQACRRDFETMLGWLEVADLLNIAWAFDEGQIREFVLTTAKRRQSRHGRARSNEPELYSSGRIGGASQLDLAVMRQDARRADTTTVVSAYYVRSVLEEMLVGCGDVRFVTNGLGGRRLEEQLEELDDLACRLDGQNRSASIRLAFSGGIFHTKLYVFESKDDVVARVGSANATSAALNGHNEEIMVRLDPAPQSVLSYAKATWNNSSDLDDCRPQVDSLAAFFRTGDIYYQPYAHLRVTVNPFRRLLDRLPRLERAKLSPFTSQYAEEEAGIGAFNVRLVYEATAGRTVESVSNKQARIRPYAIETCYGYWVSEPFVNKVDRTISEASAAKEEFLTGFCYWLEGDGFRSALSAFRGYLADAKETVLAQEVDWKRYAGKKDRHVFESTGSIEKCIEDLVAQLHDPLDREKHSHAFVTGRLPEIWDDAVARRHFEQTFFESLEVQASKRSRKWPGAKWILHNVDLRGEATADEIREALETRLSDVAWYESVKDTQSA